MARTERPREETATGSTSWPLTPGPRRPGQPFFLGPDAGGAAQVTDEEQAIAADMLREYGPAFRRLADL